MQQRRLLALKETGSLVQCCYAAWSRKLECLAGAMGREEWEGMCRWQQLPTSSRAIL